jgi:membrane fusion protein (multidrug efflux system)
MVRMNSFPRATAWVAALAATAAVVRMTGQMPAAPAAQQAAPAPTVTVARVVSQQLDRPVSLPGELSAYQDVEVRPKIQGFVESIAVDRGALVKRGAVLVRLVAPELGAQRSEATTKIQSAQSQLAEAEAKAASDEATYARLKTAAQTPGVVAGNDVETAQRTAEASRARVQLWQQNEKAAREAAQAVRDIEAYLRVTAPFDGVVTERNVHVGTLVTPASPAMLRIQQVSTLRLTVAVPEEAVAGTRPQQFVKFTVPAYPGEAFSGKVARLAHSLDAKTRTMAVELDVTNADRRLAPGMYATVAWTMRRTTPTLFVPPSAIAVTTERTFVVRIRNGQADWVDVKRGAPMKQLVEVFGDLKDSDLVAMRGTDEIRAGTRVNTKLAPATP